MSLYRLSYVYPWWVSLIFLILFLIVFFLIRTFSARLLRDIATQNGFYENYWWWLGFLFNAFIGIICLYAISHVKKCNESHLQNIEPRSESINNVNTDNLLSFKIWNHQPDKKYKILSKILSIKHIMKADISSGGVLTCYYDNSLSNAEIEALKVKIKNYLT